MSGFRWDIRAVARRGALTALACGTALVACGDGDNLRPDAQPSSSVPATHGAVTTDTSATIRIPADDPRLPVIGTPVEPSESVTTDESGQPAEIDQPFVAVADSNFIVVGYMRVGCGQPDTPADAAEACEILDAEGSVIGHFIDGRPVIGG